MDEGGGDGDREEEKVDVCILHENMMRLFLKLFNTTILLYLCETWSQRISYYYVHTSELPIFRMICITLWMSMTHFV
jgi:hypothetical protein